VSLVHLQPISHDVQVVLPGPSLALPVLALSGCWPLTYTPVQSLGKQLLVPHSGYQPLIPHLALSETSKLWKKNDGVAQNAVVSCKNHFERFMQYWARLSEEERQGRRRQKNIFPVSQVPGLVLSWCFLLPLGVLLVMKTKMTGMLL